MAKADTSGLHVRGGEFIPDEVDNLMNQDALVESACQEIVQYTEDRNACLIFASSVKHGQHVVRTLKQKHEIECGFVCGETPSGERDELLGRFRGNPPRDLFPREPLKYLCNVNVLTTGFDAPNIDCVVLLRPTMSPGLFSQMVGRGFRLHPGKKNCLVLDLGGNVLRHGPVDQIKIKEKSDGDGEAPAKECPECQSVIAASYMDCPDCGHEFPPPESKNHEAMATDEGILSGQVTNTRYPVSEVYYSVHLKRGGSEHDPKTMRVDYRTGWRHHKSEWICIEHSGYARQKAIAWWQRRSPDPFPESAQRAVEIAEGGGVAQAKEITVRTVAGEQYDRIVDYVLGPKPEPLEVEAAESYDTGFVYDDDDIPF